MSTLFLLQKLPDMLIILFCFISGLLQRLMVTDPLLFISLHISYMYVTNKLDLKLKEFSSARGWILVDVFGENPRVDVSVAALIVL